MANSGQLKKKRFKTGVNLSDGRRFEEGDEVPKDIKPADEKALKEVIEWQ